MATKIKEEAFIENLKIIRAQDYNYKEWFCVYQLDTVDIYEMDDISAYLPIDNYGEAYWQQMESLGFLVVRFEYNDDGLRQLQKIDYNNKNSEFGTSFEPAFIGRKFCVYKSMRDLDWVLVRIKKSVFHSTENFLQDNIPIKKTSSVFDCLLELLDLEGVDPLNLREL